MTYIRRKLAPWYLAALAVTLMALPAGRRADAAIPLLQGYAFLGLIICGGDCLRGFCCDIVPAPLEPQ